MVLKVGKRGVRSGNTLKASTSRHLRQYRKQSCLYRQCIRNEADATKEFPDDLTANDIKAENVPFSLNKKGRWAIPNQLKEQIMEGQFNDEDFGVQLVERHKIARRNNGISFYSSKFPHNGTHSCMPRQTKKQKGYLDIDCITNTKPSHRRSRRASNKKLSETQSSENDLTEISQIRYEVVYPCSISSSIIHNPKYIGYDTRDPFVFRGLSDGRSNRGKRHRRKFTDAIEEALSFMTEESCDDPEEEEQEPTYSEEQHIPIGKEILLKDLLHHTSRAQGLFRGYTHRRHSSSSNDGDKVVDNISDKKHIVYTPKEVEPVEKSEQITETKQTNATHSVITQPVYLVLSNDEIDPYDLKQIYGQSYLECECFPRKFIIDISNDMSNLECYKLIGKTRVDLTTACLVFTHDVENEINNARENVYKVTINMNLKKRVNSVKIETLFDYMETTIPEIVQRALFFVETLSPEVLDLNKENKNYNESACAIESTLGKHGKWKCKAHLPSETYLYQTFLSCPNSQNEAEALGFEVVSRMDSYTPDEVTDITSPKDRICYICYEEIGGTVPATALMSCGHWFCDNCWREHLVTRINSGATQRICPEYDCNRTVDPGTLLSLINVKHVIPHLKLCHDNNVEQQNVMKWCPSPQCGRVVEVSSAGVKHAQCSCKKMFCFECLGDIHWPAPCEVVPKYKKKLYDSGDESIMPADFAKPLKVNGKNCPHCKRFIEKDGGCPYMVCVCGKTFCWGCGLSWDAHQHGQDCHTAGAHNKHGTYAKTVSNDDQQDVRKGSTKWYSIAVNHRMQQHPEKVHMLKASLRKVSKSIRTYVGRARLRGDPVAFDMIEVSEQISKTESEKVHLFLRNMIELYIEVNHIAENIGVLLTSAALHTDNHTPLMAIANRLGAFGAFIYEVFTSSVANDPKLALDRLLEIHSHARMCIHGLVKYIKRVGL